MIDLCIQELTEIVRGHLRLGSMPPLGGEMEPVGRVVVDLRNVQPGDVFLALETVEHDSAARADIAFAAGAQGVIVDRQHVEPWAGKFSVVVEDTACALRQLAAWSRRRFLGQVIAVTGDAGRSTTAKMIDAVLCRRFVGATSVRDSADSLALPLSMLALNAEHDFGVVEYAVGQLGRFRTLSHLCSPDIAVINCVANHETPDSDSAFYESETLDSLSDDGWAVLNGDIPRLDGIASRLKSRVVLIGRSSRCDVVADNVRNRLNELSFVSDGVPFRVPFQGRHYLHSALAAIAVGRIMDISTDDIAEALSRFRLHHSNTKDLSEASPFVSCMRELGTALPPGSKHHACW